MRAAWRRADLAEHDADPLGSGAEADDEDAEDAVDEEENTTDEEEAAEEEGAADEEAEEEATLDETLVLFVKGATGLAMRSAS